MPRRRAHGHWKTTTLTAATTRSPTSPYSLIRWAGEGLVVRRRRVPERAGLPEWARVF
jgi:hypothetical protein